MIRRALSQLRRTVTPHQRHLLVKQHGVDSITLRPISSLPSSSSKPSFFPFFSRSFSDDASSSDPPAASDASSPDPPAVDVSDSDFERRLENYFQVKAESELPNVAEAVLKRKLSGKHEDTDEDLLIELRNQPLPDSRDHEVESDMDELFTTHEEVDDADKEEEVDDADEELAEKRIQEREREKKLREMKMSDDESDEEMDNLYNAREYVEKKMTKDEFFNMDDKKWDEMIQEATEEGYLQSTKECEGILEDMLNYDKLLPDEIKQKVQAKYNELEGMCDRGELEAEKAYELFKEFEDKMVSECMQIMHSEKASEDLPEEIGNVGEKKNLAKEGKKKVELDDPPGEGPILRWESRVVFAPGGDAWHPKNRKVKLSVTVKELGLSKYACTRLREVVGKRYNSGRDELTITSERYEHREENRKDCLKTLYGLIEDAVKADKLVEEARITYVKERLKKNMLFMERLKSKAAKLKQAQAA
ncbi:uncharacterized protein LOC144544432 [Carex rostrata]